MNYIDLAAVLETIPDDILDKLSDADNLIHGKNDVDKVTFVEAGNAKWSPMKAFLSAASHGKCWYTESKNPGSNNDVEHFRPKGNVIDKSTGATIHWYWFLAFVPYNYRFSCDFSNRKKINPQSGLTGGKGNDFPLLGGSIHASCVEDIQNEDHVLLDPCKQVDVALLEFQPDGRPVVSQKYKQDDIACHRVERSNLLLNLDYPNFNEEREALYNKVKKLVQRGDQYVENQYPIDDVRDDLLEITSETSAYSKAARCYFRCFRDRQWVEDLIFQFGL